MLKPTMEMATGEAFAISPGELGAPRRSASGSGSNLTIEQIGRIMKQEVQRMVDEIDDRTAQRQPGAQTSRVAAAESLAPQKPSPAQIRAAERASEMEDLLSSTAMVDYFVHRGYSLDQACRMSDITTADYEFAKGYQRGALAQEADESDELAVSAYVKRGYTEAQAREMAGVPARSGRQRADDDDSQPMVDYFVSKGYTEDQARKMAAMNV